MRTRLTRKCHTCQMVFRSDIDLENHRKNYCFDSKYSDPEYLKYVTLQQKFAPKAQVKQSYRDSIDLEGELQMAKKLDEEYEKLDQKDKDDYTEVNKLLRKWNRDKEVLGVKDSDVESRSQRLFALLDNDSNRRRLYKSDMEMFKKKYDDTKATTSSNVARIKEIEDIIIQRDSRDTFTQHFSKKRMTWSSRSEK